MILVIVESPAKCKKIENYLGPGYKCVASFGHIREIANGLKSIDVKNNYNVAFKTISSKGKYIKPLREAIKKATEVVLATDDDREGEAIAWHICKTFNLPIKTTKRIIFHEITKSAIKTAISNPIRVNMNTVYAQLARQVLDLLVGFTISPILWKHISRNTQGSLSAGRCQTPALRLVYEQQKLINKSPGRKVYDTIGIFTGKNFRFSLNHNHDNEDKMSEFLEESVNFVHKYSISKPKVITKSPPAPFTTSTLQQKASNEYNFSPKQTMRLAQTLYENGYITYMRTDSTKFSKEFVKSAEKFIVKKYGKEYIHKKIERLINNGSSEKKKKDNNAQEAHESIRPTKIDVNTLNVAGKITAREVKLYILIWRNTVESCMSPATYNSITAKLTAPQKHCYKYSCEQVIFPGWKIVDGYEKVNNEYKYLLSIKEEKVINYIEIYSKVALKDLKKNYSEARLVQMLEKKGIGRPSTFSSLITKIQDRGYVKKQNVEGKKLKCIDFKLIGEELDEIGIERVFGNEKNKLVIQPTGIVVYEFLEKHFDDIFNYDYTKNMEDDLDKISKGERVWYTLCEECNNQIKESSKDISDSKETYKIDKYHVYMIGRYGPVIKYEKGDETSFKSVRKDLDMDKLKRGEYKLNDVLDKSKGTSSKKSLGKYNENDVYIMKGKYGMYINCNGKNSSISHIKKELDEVVLDDILDVLKGKKQSNKNILKIITGEISIRKGKYGPYIFYKTDKMKKPKFIPMKGITTDEVTEAWVRDNL